MHGTLVATIDTQSNISPASVNAYTVLHKGISHSIKKHIYRMSFCAEIVGMRKSKYVLFGGPVTFLLKHHPVYLLC
jgi:hypothetical protein